LLGVVFVAVVVSVEAVVVVVVVAAAVVEELQAVVGYSQSTLVLLVATVEE
jgi:hypothetical protein